MSTNFVNPNLFIIGAAKSGTSSLCTYLAQHPDIFISPVKEPHYFSYKEKFLSSNGPGDTMRMAGSTKTISEYLDLFKDANNEKYIGEGSTTYLDSLYAAEQIKKFSPNCKIIIILRNPVERAFSSFLHLRRDGDEKCTTFEDALNKEKERINNNYSILWHYISRQYTYEKLRRYYEIFNINQIKIFEYEYFKNNNNQTIQEICSFLNIDNSVNINFSKQNNVGGAPKNENIHCFLTNKNIFKSLLKFIIPKKIRRSLKKELLEKNLYKPKISLNKRLELLKIYETDIQKTANLTGLNLNNWLTPLK